MACWIHEAGRFGGVMRRRDADEVEREHRSSAGISRNGLEIADLRRGTQRKWPNGPRSIARFQRHQLGVDDGLDLESPRSHEPRGGFLTNTARSRAAVAQTRRNV